MDPSARADDRGDSLALFLVQIRMPEINDQNDAERIAGVHRLMLDCIVEHPSLPSLPFAVIIPNPEPAARRHDQRKVTDEASVSDPRMRRDMGMRREQREHCIGASAGDARLRQMMQNLLVERFGVVLHNETKELPVYGLVVAKSGVKMKQVDAPQPAALRMGMSQFTVVGEVSQLISQLVSVTGRSVADETGLKGNYEMKLSWTPDPAQQAQIAAAHGTAPDFAAAEGPSLFTALEEQLGLRLDARKGPVVVYKVEKASKPSEN